MENQDLRAGMDRRGQREIMDSKDKAVLKKFKDALGIQGCQVGTRVEFKAFHYLIKSLLPYIKNMYTTNSANMNNLNVLHFKSLVNII